MYIYQLLVKNFRSLHHVSIGNLSPMVILYGNNNTGKSNVLAFLQQLFKQKQTLDITEAGERVVQRVSGFWNGEIEDFSDNYYLDGTEQITFSVTVHFGRNEITNLPGIPEAFLAKLRGNRQYDLLTLQGEMGPSEGGRAKLTLLKADFDQKRFFDSELPDTDRYLKGFDLEAAEAQTAFDTVMNALDDAFLMIPASRFLKAEKEAKRGEIAGLDSETFKNWLFQLSVDRNSEQIFREISDQFGAEPFTFGRVSLARTGADEIEIYVERNGYKLPIGRKGSGVQQILIILAYIASSNSPMIGIEELEINLSPEAQRFIFNSLLQLVQKADSTVKQIILTTHSPYIGKRNEAQRRGVWMDGSETKIAVPTVANINDFFVSPINALGARRPNRSLRTRRE